jgi:hypothetical protein
MASLPSQNLGATYLQDCASLVLLEVLLSHHAIYSSHNLQLVGSRVMDTMLNPTIKPLIHLLVIEAARNVDLELHLIL